LKKLLQVKPGQSTPISDENAKRCKKCNSELLVLSRQTRSSDEGATIFYNCSKCSRTIKVN